MSDLLKKLFPLVMDEFPYVQNPALDKAADALENALGREGKDLLRAYDDAREDQTWEDLRQVFYIGLALGIELGTLTPSVGACRRR
jgi:hypothetical protein